MIVPVGLDWIALRRGAEWPFNVQATSCLAIKPFDAARNNSSINRKYDRHESLHSLELVFLASYSIVDYRTIVEPGPSVVTADKQM